MQHQEINPFHLEDDDLPPGIAYLGCPGAGDTTMARAAIMAAEQAGKTILVVGGHDNIRPDSGSTLNPEILMQLREDRTEMLITRLPDLMEPTWIDPNTPVYNEAKHLESCAKARRKRKKKRKN